MDTTPRYVFLGLLVLVLGALFAIHIHHQGVAAREPELQGAGSTFIYPLMAQWCSRFEKAEAGCRIGYRGVGSGAGIRMMTEKSVDFSCSDAPMTDEQISNARKSGREILHIPLVLGAVVPVYNLADVKVPVRFDGSTLAEIYLGKIKKWNDPAVASLNPNVSLPDRDIVVVHRSDGSGTTFIFADYLSKLSTEWKSSVGTATDLKWPVGIGEPGNEGVAKKVQTTPGSIGYVELVYAFRFDLSAGIVKNNDGQFVKANLQSITKASQIASATAPEDLRHSLTNAPGADSYPIIGVTWAIVDTHHEKKKGRQLAQFLTWALDEGQSDVESLFYARLPETLAESARKKLTLIAGAN